MKKVSIIALVFFSLYAEEVASPRTTPEQKGGDVAKISEAFGHLLGKNLDSMGLKFDIAKVIKGLQDAADGKTSPMTEAECIQAITTAQEVVFKEAAAANLKQAEQFLSTKRKEKEVHSLEDGKVLYQVIQAGKGAIVDESSSPLIRYTGKLLDGAVFGASKEEGIIHLDETIAGFGKGLLGMKEGEKRILYIHPNLGYGTHGQLPPNSLLTFEVEIVRANAPHAQTLDALSPVTPSTKGSPELASPFEETKIIR